MSLNLRVIGAGMGRTGTTSLKIALETLLGRPCFHYLEYRSHPKLMEPWLELVGALVILSVRDTQSWWDSMHALLLHREEEWKRPEFITPERRKFLEFEETLFGLAGENFSEESEKAYFETHNQRVLDYAESDESFRRRLLVWNVKEGWGPLCRALDLPEPDMPFPHANKREEFHGY
jgi:hypothetical protein